MYTERQLCELKSFCFNGCTGSVLGFDKTYNIGPMHVTASIYKNTAEIMWLGSSQQLAKLDITHERVLSSLCLRVQDTACDLGIVIEGQLLLSAHIAVVCRSGYYQLRQLQPALWSLSEDASQTLVQAFISCRLDYCNSVFQHL